MILKLERLGYTLFISTVIIPILYYTAGRIFHFSLNGMLPIESLSVAILGMLYTTYRLIKMYITHKVLHDIGL